MDGVNRPSMGIAGWVLAAVAATMAFISFSRMAPQENLQPLFGAVGVVAVFVLKQCAGRWAKASNAAAEAQTQELRKAAEKVATWYLYACCGLAALIFLVGVAFQAAVSEDQATGVIDVEAQVSVQERSIRNAEYAAREMTHPEDSADILKQDIDRVLARPAKTIDKKPAGFSVGEAVGAGARDKDGLEPATFCMPDKARQYYIDKECPDLIDMEKDLRRRLSYDRALAKVANDKDNLEILRKSMPKKSSGLAMGEKFNPVEGAFWGLVMAAALLLGVEIFMVFCVYVSKRHPKGVTAALASLVIAPSRPPSAADLLGGGGARS